jgi:hypothetical protein
MTIVDMMFIPSFDVSEEGVCTPRHKRMKINRVHTLARRNSGRQVTTPQAAWTEPALVHTQPHIQWAQR